MLSPYIIQFASSCAVVLVLIFIPLIAQSYGANPSTVGVLVATYQGMIFLSSALFGRWSDLKGRKRFVVLGLILAAIIFYAHRWAKNLPTLFLIRSLAGLAVGIFPAAIIAYVYEQNSKLGLFTGLGSLGWGVGAIFAGLIGDYQKLFTYSALLYFGSFLFALIFLKPTQRHIEQPFFHWQIIKRNWRVYLSFFLRHAGAFGIWAIFPLFLAHLGASKLWIGIIYSINAFGQFFFMPHLERIRSTRLIQFGLYFSTATFIIFGLCQSYWQILPFQILLAFSWSCLYLGSLKYLMEHNEERSTAVGVFNSISSLAGIIGPLLGGLTGTLGYPAVMFTAAILTVAGALIFRF
ncbi:MAG: MFS transporter [candidate division WOR-3 bacterium]